MRLASLSALLLLSTSPAWGQSESDLIGTAKDLAPPEGLAVNVRVGYGEGVGHMRAWCPVEVSLRQEGGAPFLGSLTLEEWQVAVTTPRLRVLAARPVDMGGRAAKRHLLMFRPQGATVGVRIVLRDSRGRPVFRRHVRFEQAGEVNRDEGFATVLMLGDSIPIYGVLEDADGRGRAHWPVGLARPFQGARATQALTVSVSLSLQDTRFLWGLDALLVPEPARVSVEAAAAVRSFVERGGRLVVASGRQGGSLADSALAPCLPVEPLGQENRRDGLAAIDSSRPVGEVTPVVVGRLRQGARAYISGEGAPLVSRWRQGKGQVAFLAFPWDSPGFKDDAVRTRVLSEVLPLATGFDAGSGAPQDFEETATRPLVELARDETQVTWMVYLIAGFLLVVGPLDYLAWRKHRRAWVTWVVLVVAAVSFSALAFVLGRTGGQSALVAYAGVVLDPLDPTVPGPQPLVAEGLLALGSSRLQSYRIEIPSGLAVSHAVLGSSHFNPLLVAEDDGNPYAILGSRLQVELGVGSPSVFRLSGTLRGRCPVTARFLSAERLEVRVGGEEALAVELGRRGHRYGGTLEPGLHVIQWASTLPPGHQGGRAGGSLGSIEVERGSSAAPHQTPPYAAAPRLEGGRPGVFTRSHARPWEQTVQSGLVEACLPEPDGDDEALSSPRPGYVDARVDMQRGAWVLLVAAPKVDLPITRDGAPLETNCQGVYRLVLEPPPE